VKGLTRDPTGAHTFPLSLAVALKDFFLSGFLFGAFFLAFIARPAFVSFILLMVRQTLMHSV
jgi:hypothetical protein